MDFRPSSPVFLATPPSGPSAPVTLSNFLPRWERWGKTSIGSSYVTVWESTVSTEPSAFFESVFQVNDSKLLMRISVGGIVIMDGLDLDELEDDFKLEGDDMVMFSLQQFEEKRWFFRPPCPIGIPVGSTMKIEFQSYDNDLELERGIAVWGTL